MVVIAAASPLNYLVLIHQVRLLERLFAEVFVPEAVIEELSDSQAPAEVANWVANLPTWVRRVGNPQFRSDPILDTLGRGERAAISFAEGLRPDVLLVIDESKARGRPCNGKSLSLACLGFWRQRRCRGGLTCRRFWKTCNAQISESPQT